MTRNHSSLRLTAVLLSLLLLLSLFPVTAQAAASGGFEYTVNSDGTATITKYTGSDTNVVVPATIDGHRVSIVASYAFYGVGGKLDSIKTITFSEGIQWLDAYAVYACLKVETISYPSTLQSFSAPLNCFCLTQVKFPKGSKNFTMKDGVVYNKDMTALLFYPTAKTGDRFSVPSSVKTIATDAFADQAYLKEIVLPDTLTYIGYWAFDGADQLAKINIPRDCETIGQFAFMGTAIRTLNLPAKLQMIMSHNAPETLEKVTVASGNKNYKVIDGALYRLDAKGIPVSLLMFPPASTQEELIMPETITDIESGAFGQFCDNLHYLDLGGSLTEIDAYDTLPAQLRVLVVPTSLKLISKQLCFNRIMRLYYEGTEAQWNAIEGVAEAGIKHPVHFNVKNAKTHSTSYAYTPPSCAYSGTESFTCPCGWDWTELVGILDCIWGPWEILTDDPNPPRWFSYARYCTRCGRQMAYYSGEMPLNPFTDVPDDAFYTDAVRWANYKGITTGTSPTTFEPASPCMRAHVVTFLWRAAGSPEPTITENPFTDVKESDFFYKSVLWAYENGITGGVDDTHFGPAVPCNRAQVVTFLYKAKNSPAVTGTDNPFTDVPAKSWFLTPVLWAVENGITSGLGADTFGPGSVCNRAQIALFLYKAFGW